ncbi:transcription antitermination protein NusB [Mycoplasma sp. Ms02]|uniref:transcription antitermination protein NusB n=1 Tax=Mycoplasma sp. Ms02 TaxID=353851 RepID=UPI001C8AB0F5|nr:transcription antitermination protein NusB [Mycoplasma sp. Ms02]QZE12409.1 transcription antitermination protein NusB [Mycoplasma sp. Ms02]
MKKKSRRQTRIEVIQVLYSYQLTDQTIDVQDVFDNFEHINQEQLKTLEKIAKNLKFYQVMVQKFLNNDWSWERIDPIVRAILINATHEFLSIDPKIVINEALEIAKSFMTDAEQAKKQIAFINAILQNVYKALVYLESKDKANDSKN